MKHLNSMTKEQLDEFDAVINHPANEWLIFFWVMGKVFDTIYTHFPLMTVLEPTLH